MFSLNLPLSFHNEATENGHKLLIVLGVSSYHCGRREGRRRKGKGEGRRRKGKGEGRRRKGKGEGRGRGGEEEEEGGGEDGEGEGMDGRKKGRKKERKKEGKKRPSIKVYVQCGRTNLQVSSAVLDALIHILLHLLSFQRWLLTTLTQHFLQVGLSGCGGELVAGEEGLDSHCIALNQLTACKHVK